MLSSWVCKTCGTINEDILDIILTPDNLYLLEKIEKEEKRRQKYEIKGETPPIPCEQCGEQRIQGRVR